MNRELLEEVMDLAYEGCGNTCDDLSKEQIEKFSELKVLRSEVDGEVFLDKVMYQSDLVTVFKAQLLGREMK